MWAPGVAVRALRACGLLPSPAFDRYHGVQTGGHHDAGTPRDLSRVRHPRGRRPGVERGDGRDDRPRVRDVPPPGRGGAVRGLASAGCDVLAVGLVLTPMLYFALRHFGVDGGMMVTASHNPPEFNGFKLCHGPGTLYGAQIQQVREIAEAGVRARGAGRVERREIAPAYLAMLAEKIRLGPRRLRVALDCGNGTAGAFV